MDLRRFVVRLGFCNESGSHCTVSCFEASCRHLANFLYSSAGRNSETMFQEIYVRKTFSYTVVSIHLLYVWLHIFRLPRISQCTDILIFVTMIRNLCSLFRQFCILLAPGQDRLRSVSPGTGLQGFGPRQEYKVSFSLSCSDQPWSGPTLMYSEYRGRFSRVRRGRSIKLTAGLYLVQRLSRLGALTVTLITCSW
jgi:hypothetical protein